MPILQTSEVCPTIRWECRRHVGNSLATNLNVGNFGQIWHVGPTQKMSPIQELCVGIHQHTICKEYVPRYLPRYLRESWCALRVHDAQHIDFAATVVFAAVDVLKGGCLSLLSSPHCMTSVSMSTLKKCLSVLIVVYLLFDVVVAVKRSCQCTRGNLLSLSSSPCCSASLLLSVFLINKLDAVVRPCHQPTCWHLSAMLTYVVLAIHLAVTIFKLCWRHVGRRVVDCCWHVGHVCCLVPKNNTSTSDIPS